MAKSKGVGSKGTLWGGQAINLAQLCCQGMLSVKPKKTLNVI